jgi:hypothetical protein
LDICITVELHAGFDVLTKSTDVSEDHVTYIFRAEEYANKETSR